MLNIIRELQMRLMVAAGDESGMSTVEYAIGTIAAAAFGAILYTVVTAIPSSTPCPTSSPVH